MPEQWRCLTEFHFKTSCLRSFVLELSIGSIVENLKKAREIAHGHPGIPEELGCYLQKALDAAGGLDLYLTREASSNR